MVENENQELVIDPDLDDLEMSKQPRSRMSRVAPPLLLRKLFTI